MKKLIGILLFSAFFAGCAHHRDVRPADDGVHKVSVQSEDTEKGTRAAIDQANHFCKERGQHAVIVDEQQHYSGDLDEETYKKAKRTAKVVSAVGGAAWVFGSKKTSDAGGAAAVGGSVADAALGKGYTVEMKFKCKN